MYFEVENCNVSPPLRAPQLVKKKMFVQKIKKILKNTKGKTLGTFAERSFLKTTVVY